MNVMSDGTLIEYHPIDEEARGKVRQWRREAIERYKRLDEVYRSREFKETADAYVCKSDVGRRRAWKKLDAAMKAHGAHLQWTIHERTSSGRLTFAIWAVLHPGQSLTIEAPHDRRDLLQDSVLVEYLLVGGNRRMRGHRDRGLWSLEVPNHALERLVQRDRKADIGKVILEAHNAALWMPSEDVIKRPLRGFALPAGDGVFFCRMFFGAREEATDALNLRPARTREGLPHDNYTIAVRPWTWLHDDQLTEKQEKRRVQRATVRSSAMGNNLLFPWDPMKHPKKEQTDG